MATILILDDRKENRELLSTLLSYINHTVLEAATAAEALAMVRSARPDLVIADVLMPDVDGFEFVRQLRADPVIAHTRVIFYTATYMPSETRSLAEAVGVAQVLSKPAEPQAIIEVVQQVLDAPAAILTAPVENFEREHQRLLLDKLTQKVNELEAFNEGLEDLVAARTAELADANTRLSELNAFKDHILQITSHDLRSPLSVIMNSVELLLDEPALPEEVAYLGRHIEASSRRMLQLIEQLLDLARLESGQFELELQPVQLSRVARQAAELAQTVAAAKRIAIEVVVGPDEALLEGDPIKLFQVMSNLLSNATKFTPPGGSICLSVAAAPGGMQVSVADTGLGIPAEALPRLFEKFQQVHRRGTAGEAGSGLGLAIVRQLVELHGGSITVQSTPGQGSTFNVFFPATSGQAT
jgi:signal transduction histidine kinase